MESMSLTMATVLFNGVMLSLLGLVIFWFGRNPGWRRFISGAMIILGVSLFVSLIMCLPHGGLLRATRLLCFGWFGHFSLYLASTAILSKMRSIRWLAAGVVIALLAVVLYSFWIEPFRLEVTHYLVESSVVSQPLTLALLADFQTDKFRGYQRSSLRRLMQEKPDAIFLAGDYLQANTQDEWESLRDQMNAFLKEISFGAPLGVYVVGGNSDFRRWPEIFDGLPTEEFRDSRTIETDDFLVTGLSIEDSFSTDIDLAKSSSKLSIVLGHAPDFALSENLRGDLLLAGHTHGGQVRIPWLGPIITFSQVPRAWAAGKTRIDGEKTLVVSRGIGMERRDAPRLRFLCRPELAFIHVLPLRK